jgi:hypothetical protein
MADVVVRCPPLQPDRLATALDRARPDRAPVVTSATQEAFVVVRRPAS